MTSLQEYAALPRKGDSFVHHKNDFVMMMPHAVQQASTSCDAICVHTWIALQVLQTFHQRVAQGALAGQDPWKGLPQGVNLTQSHRLAWPFDIAEDRKSASDCRLKRCEGQVTPALLLCRQKQRHLHVREPSFHTGCWNSSMPEYRAALQYLATLQDSKKLKEASTRKNRL